METKPKKRNGILATIWLLLIVVCILAVFTYQSQQVLGVLLPAATPTPPRGFLDTRETLSPDALKNSIPTPTLVINGLPPG